MLRDNVIPLTEIDSLSKEIECIMCLNIANDSRMCIHCSAIVCVPCIERWLNKQQSCPKCSHSVQQTDFVRCRLANKLMDFIEISKDNNCANHPNQTPRVYCSKCTSHNVHKYIDDEYKQLMTLNHKLIDFMRKRCKDNEENLRAVELAIQMLLNDHTESIKDLNTNPNILIKETERMLDDYQQKKQAYIDTIRTDELLIHDMERRLMESRNRSDQEEILQILQKHIPSGESNSV